MKDTDQQKCGVCGDSLDNPLARARGHHESCVEKDGEGYVEK